MKTVVLASGNAGKIRELRTLFEGLGIEVVPQDHYGVSEAEEPHPTFVENALAKARHAARHTGLPALADDSGICVHALHGAPGVHSARFGGEPRSDARNNDRLLETMAHLDDRRAHYYCVLVLLRHEHDSQPLIAEGAWHGEILRAPRGDGGFGYDPLFLDPGLGLTGAELPLEEKRRVSHRGQALRALVERVRALQDESDPPGA
mgnify:CR=1 FL=1